MLYKLKKCTLENTPELFSENKTFNAKVLNCYDGDTITIAFNFNGNFFQKSCRIFGLDTPEIKTKDENEKYAGIKAKKYLENLILHKIITVKCEGKDKYGRILASIYYEGENIGEKIINAGFGYRYDGGKKQKMNF